MHHLIVFSHLRWDFVYQRPQHLLSRLARHGRVTVVEEPIAAAGEPRLAVRHTAEGVEVLQPHTPLPAHGFDDDQIGVIRPLLRDHFRSAGVEQPVLWFYTPMALPLGQGMDSSAIVYDCMDELSAFLGAPPQMRRREAELLEAADLVLTGGPSIYASKRERHPNVLCLPSAVDAKHYAAPAEDAEFEDDEAQRAIGRPRLGFFGVIDERLDLALVAAVADADPAWQVVMVGPVVKIDPTSLPQRPNLHWLGQQPYARLPRLVAGWDVCLMPFALNEATRFISPTKTLEYMAAGKPVVSTSVPDVRTLFEHVVSIGDGPAAFVEACRSALVRDAGAAADLRRSMAETVADYSWDSTADTVRAAIENVLAGSQTARSAASTS